MWGADGTTTCSAAAPLPAATAANTTMSLVISAIPPSSTFTVLLNFTDAAANWLYCLNATFSSA